MSKPASANEGIFLAPNTFYMPVRLSGLDKISVFNDREEPANFYRVILVWGGEGLLYVNDVPHELSRGSVFLCNAVPRLRSDPHSALRGIQIEYRILTADGSKPRGLEHPVPLNRCASGILRLAAELESAWKAPQPGNPVRTQQLFIEWLAELINEMNVRQRPADTWLGQVLHYMETHFNKELTRERMAEYANVSPEHFSRIFRRHTGRTFSAHLTLLRIRCAQKHLVVGGPDLNTVALEVGYKEGLYLSRKFKETVGLSPTAYKRKNKRIAALNLNHTASLMALGVVPELGVYTSWLEQAQIRQNRAVGRKLNPRECDPSVYYETIAAAHPDVIISYNNASENKNLLPLAPVVELPFMTMGWREQFGRIADIVDRRQRAEEWLAQYDELVGNFNYRLDSELGRRGTAIVWEICPNKAYCFSSSYGRGCQVLYEDMGFSPPPCLFEQGLSTRGYVETDVESIASYPADHIFITGLPSYQEGRRGVDQLFRSSSWLNLESVRDNRVYVLDQPELFCGYDPLSSKAQLSELLQVLIPHHK